MEVDKSVCFQVLRSHQLLLSPLPTWAFSGAVSSPTSLPVLGHRNHCQGYLLVHLSRHSTQPFLFWVFMPTKCCFWKYILLELPQSSLSASSPATHTQEEGSKEKKNLFLGLLKSFFLLVSWPRYFITVPIPNSPSLGLTLLEHESHRDWQNICFPALPPPSPETHHKDDYFGEGGRKEKGGKIQERKKSIYISK